MKEFLVILTLLIVGFSGIIFLGYYNDHIEIQSYRYDIISAWLKKYPEEIKQDISSALLDNEINRIEYEELEYKIDKIRYKDSKKNLLGLLSIIDNSKI